ncbi:MAG: lytic murein transglycosylase [Thiothrix sp.]|nr:MAG: lytic murein transglycosylase [Thiothrix sp.]
MRQFTYGLLLASVCYGSTAWADCRNSQDFDTWLTNFKQEAISTGLSADVVNSALNGIKLDQGVIQRDRSQEVFAQNFLEFAGKKVSSFRLSNGQKQMQSNAKLFQRIEQEYGVPAPMLTALWALETDFGAVTGDYSTLRSLATLAYDCRRPERFRPELIQALSLVQKGDQTPASMRGAWAGELGQLQFLPSGYNQQGVDFDGDGHRDLIRSKADALASAANLLRHHGWQAGQPWLVEVRVPKEMDWSKARLDNRLPLSEWSSMGVTEADGDPLRPNGQAALLLPVGRNGPAFLAFPNFEVIRQWNESTVYATTAAYLATRLAGAKPLSTGNGPIPKLSISQVRQVQSKLAARGLPVGKIDGIIGDDTRNAVRQAQQ